MNVGIISSGAINTTTRFQGNYAKPTKQYIASTLPMARKEIKPNTWLVMKALVKASITNLCNQAKRPHRQRPTVQIQKNWQSSGPKIELSNKPTSIHDGWNKHINNIEKHLKEHDKNQKLYNEVFANS